MKETTILKMAQCGALLAAGLAGFCVGRDWWQLSPPANTPANTIEAAKSKQIAGDLEKGVHIINIDENEYVIVVGQTGVAICPKSK
jgi:hypothetical protein